MIFSPPASPEAPSVDVQEAQLPEAAAGGPSQAPGQIDVLLDATIPVFVRLGQTELPVRDLLRLGPGSVIKLDRQVGQPVDVLLRGALIATGNLVVVGDHLGVRINEILPGGPDAAASAG